MNRAKYYLKEGFGSIFTHSLMSFATVCVIIACLILMGSFVLLSVNLGRTMDYLESQNQMMAFVDENLSEEDARAIQPELLKNANVSSVDFVTRQEARDSFLGKYEKNSLFDDIDASVFRDRYIIHLKDITLMADTQRELAGVSGIARVNAHLEISRGFTAVRRVSRIVAITIVALLFLVSMFIMSNTVKLTTFNRRNEIAVVKMIGASNNFIYWPFMLEGVILGLTGAFLAYLLQWSIYEAVCTRIITATSLMFIRLLSFGQIALPLLICFSAVGIFVGVFGSRIAIRNYLRV